MEKSDRKRGRDFVIDLNDPEIELRRKALAARDAELRLERLRKKEGERDALLQQPDTGRNDGGFELVLKFLFFAFFCVMCFFMCKYGSGDGGSGVPSRYQD